MSPSRMSLTALLILFSTAVICEAHDLSITCDLVPPDRVTVHVYWAALEPANGADVRVFDGKGNEIARGSTDQEGAFSFLVKDVVPHTVEATIAGHRVRQRINEAEGGGLDVPGQQMEASAGHAPPHSHQAADSHGHAHDDDHDEAAAAPEHQDSHVVELMAGVVLILSLASFVMVVSLQRRLKALIALIEKR
ncbi:MAG: hypothetical protein JSV78_12025 [Phycisphaerales bacterium]|nr:MAG: hypothetical protein JSV78_12025 [Phycisphaerales bacterium]